MTDQFYNLSWDSHKEKIRYGFTCLQQKEELVDMSLAADGYIVKVHKTIVSLVSPYLKEMISSIPCVHPVIFLANISLEVLQHIVEYIYTGEVQLLANNVQPFIKAASHLHLSGLKDFASFQDAQESKIQMDVNADPTIQQSEAITNIIPNDVNAEPTIQPSISIEPKTYNIVAEYTGVYDNHSNKGATEDTSYHSLQNIINEVSGLDNPVNVDTNVTDVNTFSDVISNEIDQTPDIKASITVNTDYKHQQYSISSRGSLQLILNRYIYLMHHQSCRGIKRRWRCSDYRRNKCKAYVDTEADLITKRHNLHNHPFHDDKILKKVKRNLVYGSIKSIEIRKQEDNIVGDKRNYMECDST